MKKNKNTIMLVLAFLTIAFYISGCKDPDPVYNQVKQEHKDWGAFKEGTWWVYEEENLKIRDSIYIYITMKINSAELKLKITLNNIFNATLIQVKM